MDQIFIGVSLLSFVIYLGIIGYFYGVQKSISDSYYTLKEHGKNTMWFSIAIVAFAFPIFFVGESVLLPLASSFICFVAAASAFKRRKQTKIVHYVGAIGGILLGMTALIVDYGNWELVVFAAISSVLLRLFTKNYFWWIEIVSFFTILLGRYLQ